MNDLDLKAYFSSIDSPDKSAMLEALRRQAALAKPPHSLGKLEDISVKLAGIYGHLPDSIRNRRVIVFSSDNGIVEEGVASSPKSVTLAQTINFTRGLTGVAVLAKHFNTNLDVIDVGIDADFSYNDVRNCKIAYGTRNFVKEPAMTRDQCLTAIGIGIEAAERAKREGMDIIGIGEMGIGNTTTSSAVLSALLGLTAQETVGRGAGINDASFLHKIEIIDNAISHYELRGKDPIEVLTCVGGFDLAAMCGAFIGAAHAHLPVVIDGFISVTAALCAYRLNPMCVEYMFPSHISAEKGYKLAIDHMGLRPMLCLDMRLGEGSGCPIAFEIIDAAVTVLRDMATFEEAAINDDYLKAIRPEKRFLGEA